jgi:hypothetical protein
MQRGHAAHGGLLVRAVHQLGLEDQALVVGQGRPVWRFGLQGLPQVQRRQAATTAQHEAPVRRWRADARVVLAGLRRKGPQGHHAAALSVQHFHHATGVVQHAAVGLQGTAQKKAAHAHMPGLHDDRPRLRIGGVEDLDVLALVGVDEPGTRCQRKPPQVVQHRVWRDTFEPVTPHGEQFQPRTQPHADPGPAAAMHDRIKGHARHQALDLQAGAQHIHGLFGQHPVGHHVDHAHAALAHHAAEVQQHAPTVQCRDL